MNKNQEKRFDKRFIKITKGTEIGTIKSFVGNEEQLKSFISTLLEEQKKEIVGVVEEMRELHKHDSIPSYTADIENGCVICIKNQALTDILKAIKDL